MFRVILSLSLSFPLKAEVDEAKDEAQQQRERAARAELSYAKLLEGRRGSAEATAAGGGGGGGYGGREGSSKFQRDLRAEEEEEDEGGRREAEMSPRVGGLAETWSDRGLPEWKWHGHGKVRLG